MRMFFFSLLISGFSLLCMVQNCKAEPTEIVKCSGSDISGVYFRIRTGDRLLGGLFGTVHMGHSSLKKLPISVIRDLESSKVLYRETDLNVTPEQIERIQQLFKLPTGQRISDILNGKDYAALLLFFRDQQYESDKVSEMLTMTPFALVSALGSKYNLVEFDGSPSFDTMLDEVAKKAMVQISGVESIDESLSGVAGFTNLESSDYIAQYIDVYRCPSCLTSANIALNAFVKNLRDGQLKMAYSQHVFLYSRLIPVHAQQQKMIFSRNDNMTKKIVLIIGREKPFVVSVGALHLAGEKGIVAQLRKRGYDVTQVFCDQHLGVENK